MKGKSVKARLNEIKEKTLFVTDTEDGKSEASLKLEDYEWLISLVDKFEEAIESKEVCDKCNSEIRKALREEE